MKKCRICLRESHDGIIIRAPEMMIGTKEEFDYLHCSTCGGLSLISIPENLSWYYEQKYYSFASRNISRPKVGFKAAIRRRAALGKLGSSNVGDRFAHWVRPVYFNWIFRGCMSLDSRILDVGCGSGALLQEMSSYGFSNLTGIDPFLPDDHMSLAEGPRILKAYMKDMRDERFDVVMLHHVFEHLEDPQRSIMEARDLLSAGGRVLIRVPLADSYAFRKYGRFWVQIDAPRHIFIPTASGMYGLAERAGLQIENIIYDSSGFQFSGSEAYLRGMSIEQSANIFSKSEGGRFHDYSIFLNLIRDGDSASFWLRLAG